MDIAGIREASRLIFVDELTGLYNRRFMRQYLRERLDQLAHQRTPLAVIMLDLDGFKQINDTYGHLDGDLILKRLAQLIRETLPAGGYAIRFAGDEFFAFLEGVDATAALSVAEGIRERVSREPFVTPKVLGGIPVRISVGVAAYPEDAPTPSELIEAADQALYRSKRMGKNCVSRAGGWVLPPEVEVLKRFPGPRLVGREAELTELGRPLLNGTGRKNCLLLVEGHRGVGKSRLLAEVMQRAGRQRFSCLFSRCLEANRAIPYSSLTHVLTDYLGHEAERQQIVRRQLPGPTLTELATIIPALATLDVPRGSLAPEDRRSLIFHGMGDLLCLLSADAPLLLFLDDAQFADEASLEVLYHLLDRDDGRVIVYAATPTEALAEQDGGARPLSRRIAFLRRSPNFQRIGLAALAPPQVAQMVTEILVPSQASPRFLERLYEASQGIPLFVEETLKGLIAKGALRTSDGVWNLDAVEPAAIPTSLEAAVLGGLEVLDREVHTMVSKAAVVGPHVDVTLLAGVLGKDPAETQQLVDQGKKQRVFEEPGPLGNDDEVRFPSQCFQQIVYSHLDQDNRRRTHRVVGEVAERLAGPKVERALGPLAFHFERSDDAAKAELYRRRVQEFSGQLFSAAEIARELSLKVGAVETGFTLDERTWPIAERFLRALSAAIKNNRVYPAGSQLVVEGVAAATGALLELLGRVNAVAFAEESQVLNINGHPVESKGSLPVAQDLLRAYAEHGIRRCTFERGATQADLMGLLTILSGPSAGIQHDVGFWERRLKVAGIDHIQVFPVIHLAATEGRAVWRREARLDDSTLALVRDLLRSLAAAVDNIRRYPPESKLTTFTLDQLEHQAQGLFERIPSLTVATAEGTIVVNATRPNQRLFGITTEILQKLLEDCGLTSLTIRRGVTREHFRVFLTHLAQPLAEAQRGPTFWRNLLEGVGISTIEVGTAVGLFAEAETDDPDAIISDMPPQSRAAALTEAELMLRRVKQWLKDPPEKFLDREIQAQIPAGLGSLRQLGREDLAQQLIARTWKTLAEPDGKFRWKAAQGLTLSLGGADEAMSHWLLGQVLEPISDALSRETNPEAFGSEAEFAAQALKRLLRRGDLAGSTRLAEALGGTSRNQPEPEKFTEIVRAAVESLAAEGAFAPVLKALKESDPGRQKEATRVLTGLGTGAVGFLIALILEGDDEEIARTAAQLVRAQGDASVRLLTRELEQRDSVEEVRRIVAVLDLIAPALGREFLFLLAHPEVEVRAEVARTLSRVPREHALRFLELALSKSKPGVLLGALECVRGLRMGELVEDVVSLLDDPPNDQVRRATCLCLGGLGDQRALDPLLQILGQNPRFFGLVRGLPEGIRATAARSLGELQFPEAKRALEAALKDRSKTVRAAARFALLKFQQRNETKPKR